MLGKAVANGQGGVETQAGVGAAHQEENHQLHQEERLHVIYLAVDPDMQHHGLAAILMEEVIHYAQEHHLMVSLETHNPDNVPMYEHFGFKLFGIVQKHFDLKQYCLIREIQ